MKTIPRPPQTVSRTLEQLADLIPDHFTPTPDHFTPTPDQFAQMIDEPYTEPAPLPSRRRPACNGQKLVIVWHSPNSMTTETAPCDCNEHSRCNHSNRNN